MAPLNAPFPWFGGKRRVAPEVWSRFGRLDSYVEPFFGSGAVLLAQPATDDRVETVNDKDGLVANFWRAVRSAPREVAEWADWPVNENDLHARHAALVQGLASLPGRLEGDPGWCDARIAGWWVWGISCWIGSGFCSGDGPWTVDAATKRLVLAGGIGAAGVSRQLPYLKSQGQGIHVLAARGGLDARFEALSLRLRHVRVCCGDWSRVMGPSAGKIGMAGVFLDPPYLYEGGGLYREEAAGVSASAASWAVEHGEEPNYRIALCGYEGEHEMPATWEKLRWSAGDGYGGQAEVRSHNGERECVWFSPGCLLPQRTLFQEEVRGRVL